jgi:hypothetical protein
MVVLRVWSTSNVNSSFLLLQLYGDKSAEMGAMLVDKTFDVRHIYNIMGTVLHVPFGTIMSIGNFTELEERTIKARNIANTDTCTCQYKMGD